MPEPSLAARPLAVRLRVGALIGLGTAALWCLAVGALTLRFGRYVPITLDRRGIMDAHTAWVALPLSFVGTGLVLAAGLRATLLLGDGSGPSGVPLAPPVLLATVAFAALSGRYVWLRRRT